MLLIVLSYAKKQAESILLGFFLPFLDCQGVNDI